MNLLPIQYCYSSHSDSNSSYCLSAPVGFSTSLPLLWWLRLDQQTIPVYIVSQISQTYLGLRPNDTYCSYQKIPCSHRLNAKNMLHSAANLCPRIITFYLSLSQFLVATAFSLNMTTKTKIFNRLSLFPRTVSRIRPHRFAASWGKRLSVTVIRIDLHSEPRNGHCAFGLQLCIICISRLLWLVL